jgi:hypothetical protein
MLRIAILLTAGLSPATSWAADPLPRSILILDQSDRDSAWYAAFSPAFRSTLNAASPAPIAIYAEHLDLARFRSSQHDEVLRSYLRDKLRDRPIGVLLAQGSSALEFVMGSRAELWPAVPVIFAAVDEETAARLNLPSDATGTIYQLPFRNRVAAAQALVPNLRRIALVGDSWEHQEISAFAAQFEFIDLLGLPMTEIMKRVAVLPDDTAIIYMGLTLDGAGSTYVPQEGLAAFARVANRRHRWLRCDACPNSPSGDTDCVAHPRRRGCLDDSRCPRQPPCSPPGMSRARWGCETAPHKAPSR